MMARVRPIILLIVAALFATGAARTVHMFADHTGESTCSSHVQHACDHGHDHSPAPGQDETPEPDDHKHHDSCDLCAVLASIASQTPSWAVTIVPVAESETPLLTSSLVVFWTTAERSVRTSRGPPALA